MSIDLKSRAVYPAWANDIVRYRDLDPNAHVSHLAIGEYFENGRVRLRHQQLARLDDDILKGFVLAKLSIQFNLELHFPGEVSVGTAVSKLGNTSYTLVQGLFCDDRCIANSEVITVYMGKETGRPTPLTDELRAALQEVALIEP
ncbi:MAG: thioesterase family protein [Pseudomonadota bacterium]